MRRIACFIVMLSGLCLAQHPTRYRNAAVASDSAIASHVGADILKAGGNAIDAAVAVGFALAVVHPAAGNIGGGGFMVIRLADGNAITLDFREVAPRISTADMYKARPGDSLVGYRAAGVPGSVAGFAAVHKRYGKLSWKKLVEPAIRLANDGFVLPYGLAESLRGQAKDFMPFPQSYAIFNRNGNFYKPGDLWKQPDLAKTLVRVRDSGSKGFYEGETAMLIAACGSMTVDDLKAYQPTWRSPIRGSYKGYEVITMPSPSSGGVALVQMLNMLRNDDLKALGFGSSDHLHLLAEVMKRAFADRSLNMADPDFEKVPVAELLNVDYADRLRKSLNDKATPSSAITPFAPGSEHESEETTHYSIVDGEGNAVSTTYTLNGSFGSFAVVPGAGFLLNNEMDDFTTQPGKPNMFGLVQGAKNKIVPGKRPLSSMTPTIVTKAGKLVLVLGSPGGPTIINTVLQTFLNVVEFGMNIQRAVSMPRFHHQWMPDEIRWESFGIPADVRRALEGRGHQFESTPRSFGSCQAVMIDSDSGDRMTGVDPRISTSGAAGN